MKFLALISFLAIPLAQAEPVKDETNIENYQQCMFSEVVQLKLENSDEPLLHYPLF